MNIGTARTLCHYYPLIWTVSAVHVPTVPIAGLHPLTGDLPPRYKAAEPAAGPGDRRPQALRLRLRQTSHQGRA